MEVTFLIIVHLIRKIFVSLWSEIGNTQKGYVMEIEKNKLERILSDLERYRSDYNSSNGRAR